jgi:DNA repair exonuclease SbcCD ATPase subunit
LINFKTIRYKNILAVGNDFIEIRLNKASTTLISGTNGSGKSTFIEALFYGMFGRPYRNINKPQLINSITAKNLLVELEFDIGKKHYLVRRGMRPNIFEIHVNGKMINQASDSRDYQEMLEKQIFRMNHKSATQIIILGTANFIPFMQLSPGSRRNVIEDLLDIQVFSTMNSLLRDRINQNKQDLVIADRDILMSEEKIDLIKGHIEQLKKNTTDIVEAKRAKIDQYQESLNTAAETLVHLRERLEVEQTKFSEFKTLETRKSKLLELESTVETRRSRVKKDIKFFHDNDNCPTCRQAIDGIFKAEVIEKRKSQLSEADLAMEKLETQLTSLASKLEGAAKVLEKISSINDKITAVNAKVTSWNQSIEDLNDEIERLLTTSQTGSDDDTRLEEAKTALKDRKKKLANLKKHRRTLEIVQSLLKDGGIKTRIIRQYIPVINKLINRYLSMMDFYVTFELNEKFEEQIRSRNRDEFSYASFSEGEKSRIDLALLFTWRAIARMRNSAATNLLILDETFDSSLDQSGVDELIKIIDTVGVDSNVFVISHGNEGQLYDKFRAHIRFEKVKGFTKMVL